ncbi:MAG: phosphatase PAP2 family protein [Oscillospiraceae bacterium]|nr:phosphatase PAP2 family protein [Oscillospiraceae bacterium]
MQFLSVIASIRSDLVNSVFSLVTKLGEEIVVIVILCAIFWCLEKKLAYCIGISYFLSGLLVQDLKIIFRIDRPWILDSSFKPVPSAIEHASGYSFPSGHTQSATSLFGTIGLSLKKTWQKILCFVIFLLVGFSRMYLGVHTMLDVAVSMAITFGIAVLMVLFYDKGDKPSTREWFIPAVLTLFAVATGILATCLHSAGIITEDYVLDCLKATGAGVGFAVGMYLEKQFIQFSVKCKSLWLQLLKYLIGIVGVLVVKEGLKLIIGTGMIVDTFRYILIGLFITAIYPLVIKKWFMIKEMVYD